MTYEFFNDWHLGDNLFQCLYMHRLAARVPDAEFVLYCKSEYHKQLQETTEHEPRIGYRPLEAKTPKAYNCWVGKDNYWHQHPKRNAYISFYLDWFSKMSHETGLPDVFKTKDDMWWDFPAIKKLTPLSRSFDFLIVNAPPLSCQLAYSQGEMDQMITDIRSKGHSVIVTNPTSVKDVPCTLNEGLSVCGIGNVSNLCKHHIVIGTGPSLLTWNVFNRHLVELRVVMNSATDLDYTSIGSLRFTSISDTLNFLKRVGCA